jgi:hypothetical protein
MGDRDLRTQILILLNSELETIFLDSRKDSFGIFFMCAGHVRQQGGGSPLTILMEEKV